MRRNWLAVLGLVMVLVLGAAACGGGDDSGSDDEGADNATAVAYVETVNGERRVHIVQLITTVADLLNGREQYFLIVVTRNRKFLNSHC